MAGQYQNALDRLSRARRLGGTNDVILGPLLEAMLRWARIRMCWTCFPIRLQPTAAMRGNDPSRQGLGDAGAGRQYRRHGGDEPFTCLLKDYDGVMTAGRIYLMQGNFDAAMRKSISTEIEAPRHRRGNAEDRPGDAEAATGESSGDGSNGWRLTIPKVLLPS